MQKFKHILLYLNAVLRKLLCYTLAIIHNFDAILSALLNAKWTYNLLTYLCGHKNPIIGFRPALKLLSRRLCLARASSSWSHRAKSGPLQPGLSNAYAVVLSVLEGRRPPHQTLLLEERVHPSEGHGRASGTAGY